MGKGEQIIPAIIIIAVLSLIGLHVANNVVAGFFVDVSVIVFLILFGAIVFSVFLLLRQSSQASGTLNLDNLIVPIAVIIGIIMLFIYFPDLIPNKFSLVRESFSSIQGNPGGLFSLL